MKLSKMVIGEENKTIDAKSVVVSLGVRSEAEETSAGSHRNL